MRRGALDVIPIPGDHGKPLHKLWRKDFFRTLQEALRKLDSGHGIDTTDGRTYSEAVADGLEDTARRLNNLVTRGHLK